MNDPVDDIAASVASYLEGASGTLTESTFVVQKTSAPNDFLYREEHRWQKTVLVVPFGIVSERIGRAGQAVETYQINVIATEKLESTLLEAEMHKLTRQITLLLRVFRPAPLTSPRGIGFGWSGDETISRCDPDLLQRFNCFASLTRFSYQGTA